MEPKRVREWVVPDMSCEGCVQAIRRSLSELAGVAQVAVELNTKRVQVQFDPAQVQEEAIQSRIEQAGFSPQPAPLTQGE
jgi:copper ion binding protein